MDEEIKLIDAVTKFIGAIAWPAVVIFVLVRFGSSFREFLTSMGEFSLKGVGFEASAKRKQAEAAAALAAAEATKPIGDADRGLVSRDPRLAASVVAQVATPRVIRRISGSKVLWVDDRPTNNIYPRQALEALGITIELALSTDEALAATHQQRFDAIISDMGRPPDPRAGYTLLDALRAEDDRTPFVIYSGSRDPEHQAESRKHGAIGCTNRANELLAMVLGALSHEP
jgi:CheY-like chemotaxis protein